MGRRRRESFLKGLMGLSQLSATFQAILNPMCMF